MDILKKVDEKYVIDTRQYLHQNPELSLEEKNTSLFVQEELSKLNIPFELVDYGIIALIEGKNKDKMVLLRADMDALAIEEENPHLEYTSQNNGVMHACGHDAHTAMLLGAVKILNQIKSELEGSVVVCFQQAEEMGVGAIKLIEPLTKYPIKGCFGIHVSSKLDTGIVGIASGVSSAASDTFTVNVKGFGGHSSRPDLCKDPLLACATMVTEIAKAKAIEFDPFQPLTISVGSLHSGSTDNVIPDNGFFIGMVRSFSKESRDNALSMIDRVVKTVSELYKVESTIDISNSTKVVYNDPKLADFCKDIAKNFTDEVIEIPAGLGAEDFSEFSNVYPGVFAYLGTKNESLGTHYPHHHPKFNIDESGLKIGVALHVQYSIDFLKSQ